jgi:hypothetical protein
MAVTKEALSTSVVVRRVGIGATPFGWEIHRTDIERVIHASPARFAPMDAAYAAGAAELAEFTPKRSAPPGGHSRPHTPRRPRYNGCVATGHFDQEAW